LPTFRGVDHPPLSHGCGLSQAATDFSSDLRRPREGYFKLLFSGLGEFSVQAYSCEIS
jgi:hypothetical protein